MIPGWELSSGTPGPAAAEPLCSRACAPSKRCHCSKTPHALRPERPGSLPLGKAHTRQRRPSAAKETIIFKNAHRHYPRPSKWSSHFHDTSYLAFSPVDKTLGTEHRAGPSKPIGGQAASSLLCSSAHTGLPGGHSRHAPPPFSDGLSLPPHPA